MEIKSIQMVMAVFIGICIFTSTVSGRTAIEDYTKAIELNPNYADAYYNRGLATSGLEEQKNAPGFEAMFVFIGLLIVAYPDRKRG